MLRLDNRNINLNASSLIDEEYVASMSSTYSGDSLYFNFTINNQASYEENAELVNADFLDFIEAAVNATK